MERVVRQAIKTLGTANISIKKGQKECNDLFFMDEYPHLQFNGYSSINEFRSLLHKTYSSIKRKIDRKLNAIDWIEVCNFKHLMQVYLADFKTFLDVSFKDDAPELSYSRVVILNPAPKNTKLIYEAKDKVFQFLNAQKFTVINIIALIESRIEMINDAQERGAKLPILSSGSTTAETQKPQSVDMFDQVNQPRVHYWNGDKNEIIHILYLLNKLGKFKTVDGKAPSYSSLYQYFGEILNFDPKYAGNILNYTKFQQKPEDSILHQLVEAQENLYE